MTIRNNATNRCRFKRLPPRQVFSTSMHCEYDRRSISCAHGVGAGGSFICGLRNPGHRGVLNPTNAVGGPFILSLHKGAPRVPFFISSVPSRSEGTEEMKNEWRRAAISVGRI